MTEAAESCSGLGGFVSGRLERNETAKLIAALQLGHDQGINGGTVEDHLDHAQGFVEAVRSRSLRVKRLVDLGSGGGYPGLVLAFFLPSTTVTLTEVREKRADFLRRAVYALDLDVRVEVFGGDVTEFARLHPEHAEVVTARSFASPAITAESAARLLVPGGSLMVSEPPSTDTSQRWPEEGLATIGLRLAEEQEHRGTRMVVIDKITATAERYPRSRRQMLKNPLF